MFVFGDNILIQLRFCKELVVFSKQRSNFFALFILKLLLELANNTFYLKDCV